MDRVLGVAMTSAAVRMVLVDGATGEGATVDRDVFDIAAFEAAIGADGGDVLACAGGDQPYAVGVTWTEQAAATASQFLQVLAALGLENVVTVSQIEAADALARGIADIGGYADLAVCIVEPDEAVVATIGPQGVRVERIDRSPAGASTLANSLTSMIGRGDWWPEATFVVGCDNELDVVATALTEVSASPVICAAEADLALARGAALASARAVNGQGAQAAPVKHGLSRVGTLTSVLVAAVVTFVVSLSIALGLRLVPTTDSNPGPRDVAKVADQPAAPPPEAPPPPAAPPPPEAPPPPPVESAPVIATVSEPIYDPPAAEIAPAPEYQPEPLPAAPPPAPEYVPAVPAYVPPPPPAYVPPAPQPRLRDRIIERIPILNRFHDPQYPGN